MYDSDIKSQGAKKTHFVLNLQNTVSSKYFVTYDPLYQSMHVLSQYP